MASLISPQNDRTYLFKSQPKSLPGRGKYRDTNGIQNQGKNVYGNIMYDRRIIRGNTYATTVLPATAQTDAIEIQRRQEAKRRLLAKKLAMQQLRVKTPEPIDGRKHVEIQTELYLEELSDRVDIGHNANQTDAFLDRPPSPYFIPSKLGVDNETQIYADDLFDFNIEVQPLLEVLVGKTVEQALLEVMEEEELANLRQQQREHEELRSAENIEQMRLEEQNKRLRNEKEERMKQQAEILQQEKETALKMAARAFAHGFLKDLVPTVFGLLSDHGYFYDPVERDVETNFLPWLMTGFEASIVENAVTKNIIDILIKKVVTQRKNIFKSVEEKLKTRPSETVIKITKPTPSAQTLGQINLVIEDASTNEPVNNTENDEDTNGDEDEEDAE